MISGGRPHNPAGLGSIAPPMSPCPSTMIFKKLLRSMVSCIARRMSGSLNGGASRLTSILIATGVGVSSQIAFGAWLLMSRIICTVTS